MNEATLDYLESHPMPSDDAGFKSFADAGCLFMGVGIGGQYTMDGEEGWDGHLVVVVPKIADGRHRVIDATIVQMHKPEWDAPMKPMILRVGDAFLEGTESKFEVNGLFFIYCPRPADHTYREGDALTAFTETGGAAAEIINDLKMQGII